MDQAPGPAPVEETGPESAPLSLTDGRVPRFPALVREALAVLAAILVSFALDAWWERSVERSDMLDALDAVAVEIERNILIVDSAATFNDGRGIVVSRVAGFSLEDIDALSDSELVEFANLPDYNLATMELGAATAFIEGGYLAVLEDRELRAAIAGLPSLQLELDEEAAVVQEASGAVNRSVIMSTPIELFLVSTDPTTPESSRNILRAVLSDEAALRSLLARTFFLTYLYGAELERTEARLIEILARIETYRGG